MSSRTWSALLVVAGGTLMAVSAFLTWVEVRAPFLFIDRAAYNGLETGDGQWAISVGIVTGLLGIVAIVVVALPSMALGTGAVLGSGIGGWVAWTNFDDVPRFQTEVASRSAGDAYGVIGPGLWALGAGAAIGVIGGLLLFVSTARRGRAPDAGPIDAFIDIPAPPAGADLVQSAPAAPAQTVLCLNGHPMDPAHRFCPSCGKERWT